MFEGFERFEVETSDAEINVVHGGQGPPVLLLHGQEAPVMKLDIVRATVRLLGLDGAVFERVFALRGGAAAPGEREADELFASYIAQIERVIEADDRLDTSDGR